jgi:hypothetical protein
LVSAGALLHLERVFFAPVKPVEIKAELELGQMGGHRTALGFDEMIVALDCFLISISFSFAASITG